MYESMCTYVCVCVCVLQVEEQERLRRVRQATQATQATQPGSQGPDLSRMINQMQQDDGGQGTGTPCVCYCAGSLVCVFVRVRMCVCRVGGCCDGTVAHVRTLQPCVCDFICVSALYTCVRRVPSVL